MKTYHASDNQRDFDTLPPFQASAGYRVIEGNPRTAIRFDRGSASTAHRLGVWRCTPGAFECIEKGNELQVILSGKLRITMQDGTHHDFSAGDSFYSEKGERVIWTIIETVEKVFFTHDIDGE